MPLGRVACWKKKDMSAQHLDGPPQARQPSDSGHRNIVLVGLMGAGKSCIGRRLANRLGVEFLDADVEIEKAAGCSIQEIFDAHGEEAFRDGERRVIERLLGDGPRVIATGGGAFMDPRTREAIGNLAVSVWLRADLDLLVRRTARRHHRPLLRRGKPREILSDLMELRYPVYAEADLVVDSQDGPPEETVNRVMTALRGAGALPAPVASGAAMEQRDGA